MIINSLLDTDFYKFTMQQLILHQYPDVWAKYKFKCRNPEQLRKVTNIEFYNNLSKEIDHLCSLRFIPDELNYLSSIPFFKKDYIEYLRIFQLNRDYVRVYIDDENDLQIIIEGTWLSTILFEIPLLAIVSELYGKMIQSESPKLHMSNIGISKLCDKLKNIDKNSRGFNTSLQFADFGTRRRFSFDHQKEVLKNIRNNTSKYIFIGTSNVYFAKELNMRPIGTMAHEYLMAFQQLTRLRDSQKLALECWVKEYRGSLGIALTDCINMDAFLSDFDLYFCKLFDGCRHDSGDPEVWCNKLINHYKSMNIDPRCKSAVFSDGLTFKKAIELHKKFRNMINLSFGIGTNLTNDCGIGPLNIVIKMVECNEKPVAKISDSPGKGMCEDEGYLNYLKSVFEIN